MIREYLLTSLQPSTFTGRGLRSESRGLVGTWVEGCIPPIRFIQARDKESCRGCRHLFSNYFKETGEVQGKRDEKAYRDNNSAKCLHPLLPRPLGLASVEGRMTDRRKQRDRARRERRKAREAAREAAASRREQRNRRFEDLMEAWRRNRPNTMRKTGRIGRRGRMFFWPQPHQQH